MISGGGWGIGAATARRVAAAGWLVCLSWHADQAAAEAVAAAIAWLPGDESPYTTGAILDVSGTR